MVLFSSHLMLVLFTLCLSISAGCARQSPEPHGVLSTNDGVRFRLETVLTNLEVPWSIAFLGDDLYVTERPGRLVRLGAGETSPTVVATIAEVSHSGEGGLMGLAFHPQFASNRFVYLSYTYSAEGKGTMNKVMRYRLTGEGLTEATPVIDDIPGAGVHNGCRIQFGPDGKLYVTTGDAAQRQLAQDMNSLAGKMLRVNDDGSVPEDNPFPGSPVYSLGHRNAQGFDWHSSGLLFSTEHGPSGFDGPGGGDEINIVEGGMNYGWPIIHHQQTADGFVSPLLEFTPAIAPAGACFASGRIFPRFADNFFVATLRGRHLLRVILIQEDSGKVNSTERLLEGMIGRIRDVVEGPDGSLYIATSNRDGRGSPHREDDRILRILPP